MQGRVKLVGSAYGFVTNEGGEWFFHRSQVIGPIAPNDRVEFWIDDSPVKPGELVAVEVRRLNPMNFERPRDGVYQKA
jgi:hypothetical protein